MDETVEVDESVKVVIVGEEDDVKEKCRRRKT